MKKLINTYVEKIGAAIRVHLAKNPNDLLVFSFTFLIVIFIAVVTPLAPVDKTTETADVKIETQEEIQTVSDKEAIDDKKDTDVMVIKAGSDF